MILERFNVAQEKDDLIFLDLNRWFGKKASIIETLGKVILIMRGFVKQNWSSLVM